MNTTISARVVGLRLIGVIVMLASLACQGGGVTQTLTARAPLSPTAPLLPNPLPSPTIPAAPATPTLSASPAPSPQCTRANEAAPAASQVYLRVNQVGYLPAESKLALALTNVSLDGQSFNVVTAAGSRIALSHAVGDDRGAYGKFAHLYELDFGSLMQPGAYRLVLGSDTSPCFVVAPAAYAAVIPATLQFFRVQRCGDIQPALHGVCHREDGIAQGGPSDGSRVDATGGWHDAGDYLKFLTTIAYSVDLMLTAYQRHPQSFANNNGSGTPEVLAEARIGLSWMLKMWDPQHDVLYYQVGDGSDHNQWRRPEGDDASRPARLVWACGPGRGANVAGRAAAALALAATLWNDPAHAFHDARLADQYLAAAKQLYAYGRARPAVQAGTSHTDEVFYADASWQDDMALAAVELYRATQEPAYLKDARDYAADGAGEGRPFNSGEIGPLARYELSRLDPTYVPTAAASLADDLSGYQAHANADPFRVAAAYGWGSAESMIGAALVALWYEDLTGNSAYQPLALAQRDYLLGSNPWGVSFVNSIGSTWPHHPHHQVAALNGAELVGFWDEGPVPLADYLAQNITLNGADAYAAFQSAAAVFHDDVQDYITNEPTISMNATGLALVAWYAPPQR